MTRKPPVITPEPVQALVRRLRFRQLQMVVELVDTGSLRKASTRLALSQPAVSKSLSELESTFGFSLFARSARGIEPTAQGLVMAAAARALIADLAYWQAEAERVVADAPRLLRIGAPPTLLQSTLPMALQALHRSAPELRVELTEARVPDLFVHLREERLDALVTSYNAAIMSAGKAFVFEKLGDEEQVVACAASHPLARRRKLAWHEVVQERWVLPDTNSFVRQSVDGAFVRAGLVPPEPAIISLNPSLNVRLVGLSLGLTVLPRSLVAAQSALQALKLQPPLQHAPVALVIRRGRTLQTPLKLLREAFKAVPG